TFAARVPWLARKLAPRRMHLRNAETGARVTFFDKGIRRTKNRTGVLVYVSLVEREVVVLADDGVMRAVSAAEWDKATGAIAAVVRENKDALMLAKQIATLGNVLARRLPLAADDVNELPDEVSA